MFSSIRDSLTWLHTWGGVFLGSILFAVFWMGTLSVFDRIFSIGCHRVLFHSFEPETTKDLTRKRCADNENAG